MVPPLHFAEKPLTLHFFLERFQRLVDVVIADNDLNYLKLSINFQAGAGLNCLQGRQRRTGGPRSLQGMRRPARRGEFS